MPAVKKQSSNGAKTKRGKVSVLDRITGIQFDNSEGIKIVLYGRSGSGKTTLWSSFPGKILSVICSGGSKPGELRSIDTPEIRKKVQTVNLIGSTELSELIGHQQRTHEYSTIVLDHVTGFQDLVLKEILGIEELPEQKAWGTATMQEYGQCTAQVKNYLRALLSLECNVAIIGQEREFVPDDGELLMPNVGIALTPSLAGWLNPASDFICQTFLRQKEEQYEIKVGDKKMKTKTRITDQVEYCLRTGPHSVFTTKFRKPKEQVLPDVIVDPDYNKIMDIIQGKN